MTTKTKYRILAVIICIVIYVIYLAIAMSLGWKHGGGVLILAILFGVISWVWKTAGEMADKADAQKKVENQERLLDDVGAEPELEPTSNEEEILPEQPVEPSGDMNPEEVVQVTPPTITSAIQLELNGILKALFLLWMVVAGIQSIVQFVSNIEGSYAIGAFDLAFTFLGITGIAGMYVKKRWGLFVAGIFYILQFIFCLYIGDTDTSYYNEAIKVVIRVIVICGLLFIRKDGHSAWETIWQNGVLNPAVPLADDDAKENIGNDDLPPIPEEIVDEQESKERSGEMKESIIEEIASPCVDVPSKPIEVKDNKFLSHLKKYKWNYLIIFLLLSCSAIGGVFLVRSLNEQKEQKRILEKQHKYNELVSKGIEAHSNDLDELAMKYLDEAQSLSPSKWELYYYRGKIAMENENFSLSHECLSKAYDINSLKLNGLLGSKTITYSDLLYDYGRILWRTNRDDESRIIAQEYSSLYPNSLKGYHLLIYTEADAGNSLKAMKWAKKMVEAYPYEAESYYCLAFALLKDEKYSQAIYNYKKCLELDPERYGAYNNMGMCYKYLGYRTNAKVCFEKAIELGADKRAVKNLKELIQK